MFKKIGGVIDLSDKVIAEQDSEIMEISEDKQHPDFIWTWKSNVRGQRSSLWIPYLKNITKIKGKKSHWLIAYNGGEIDADLGKVDFVMFYGLAGDLPIAFLDDLSAHGICLMIHRRNMPHPLIMYTSFPTDLNDLLTKQILYRENNIKRVYISRAFLLKRFDAFTLIPEVADRGSFQLNKAKDIVTLRTIEAEVTAKFWKKWAATLNLENFTRRSQHPVAVALDACSFFMYGQFLRWILFHKLSPCHAFLHQPSNYPSLPYDLMEPYRYIFEDAVAACVKKGFQGSELSTKSLDYLKESVEEIVYVPATRQNVRRKNLIHGAVLALRAYLLGETKKLILPTEGQKNGGRPPQVSYKLPGEVW